VAVAIQGKSKATWKLLAIGAFLGVCPDFDYILNWLRIGWGGWHHGFTHSFVFALVVGAVATVVTGWRSVRSFITGGFASKVFSAYLCGSPRLCGNDSRKAYKPQSRRGIAEIRREHIRHCQHVLAPSMLLM
jgi:hypothetical protein